jgi:hypothetical protein
MPAWLSLRVTGYALIVACVFAAGWYVNGARWQSRLLALKAEQSASLAAGYKAALAKYDEANQRALAAEAKMAEWKILAGKKVVVYRDAVKKNPDCAAQAAQRLLCPKPW